MGKILGLLLRIIQKRMKNSVGFIRDIRATIFVFIISVIGVEVCQLGGFNEAIGVADLQRNSFVICTTLFYLLFCLIGYMINLFEDGKMGIVLSTIVALPLGVLLFRYRHIALLLALIIAVGLRLILGLISCQQQLIKYGIFLMGAVAVFLWYFYDCFETVNTINRLLFAAIIVISLSSIQQILVEKNKGEFPFHFFLLLCLFIIIIPVKPKPLDWSRVQSLAGKLADASDNVAYYFSGIYDNGNYDTGYSNLQVNGGKVKKSNKNQLALTTSQMPYIVYTDSTTGKQMKGRKVIYLQGQQGVDNRQLIEFLQFLYNHNVDRSKAGVFSQISKISIEYVYLTTGDEIVPRGVISLKSSGGEIHKKGYKEDTVYLDIDYGSPVFMQLCEEKTVDKSPLSYEQMCKYTNEIYRMDLSKIISKQEYEASLLDDDLSEFEALPKDDKNLHDLAMKITKHADNDYDKCRLIEGYLRQYPYTTDAVGGYDKQSTMATADGMGDIAGRFLFDTKEGYCVHFTASMVMLLREAGIPARAMSGFRYLYPYERQKEYKVQANCAHLWPEAYIDGIGWIPFEPTSAYYSSEEVTWHRGEGEKAVDNGDVMESLVQIAPEIPTDEKADSRKVDKGFVVTVVVIIVLSIAALIGFAIAITVLIRYVKYKHASLDERLIMDVESIKLQLVKNSASQIEDRGLLSDYLVLVADILKPEVQHSFNLYYKILYGGKTGTITKEDSIRIHQLVEAISKS